MCYEIMQVPHCSIDLCGKHDLDHAYPKDPTRSILCEISVLYRSYTGNTCEITRYSRSHPDEDVLDHADPTDPKN